MTKRKSSSSEMGRDVAARLEEGAALKREVAARHAEAIARMAAVVVQSYRSGGKLLVCGNGGSAADAQHMAGELVGRFLKERRPLSCIALTTDSSVLTAIGNDYGFEQIFARQLTAHGRKEDVLLAISTSGNSPNVLNAAAEARRLGMKVVALSGRGGGALAGAADLCVVVPSTVSQRIQEIHGAICHIICEIVEESLFGG